MTAESQRGMRNGRDTISEAKKVMVQVGGTNSIDSAIENAW